MSHAPSTDDPRGQMTRQGNHGADHVPHVTPLEHYLAVFAALIVLTAITVGVSYLDFGPWNLVIAMVVATLKATLVAAIFMHLLYDQRFHAVIFSFAVIFLAIFIVFTSFDTFARGRADLLERLRPARSEDPFSKSLRARPIMDEHVPTLTPRGEAPKAEGKPTH